MANLSLQEDIAKEFEKLGGFIDGFFVTYPNRSAGKGDIHIGCNDATGSPDYDPKRTIRDLQKAASDALADHGIWLRFENEYVEVWDQDPADPDLGHTVDIGITGTMVIRSWDWQDGFTD